ncbi:ADP-ribosylhydrolase ARH3-like isoform X2 [Armigeres subalbatus]|uniref:ADP-ribosylhydrolase ARH3-like isoform X2 n=1 Tax=Armigeres subalbatus TaxID=124917 RepID=UPI002ECFB375
MDKILLRSKFRGSLLGALIGDCCGAPFEGQLMDSGSKLVLRQNLDKLEGPFFKAPYKKYTDDTAMTKCVLNTLLSPTGFSQQLLAKSFVLEYFKDPRRGYGAAVGDVFDKLRKTKLADPVGPAAAQFGGSGSFGNGAAMRVAPIALYCVKREKSQLLQMVRDASLVTHSHTLGVNGAILEALAITHSLRMNPKENLNAKKFLAELKADIIEVESANDPDLDLNLNAYQKQLDAVEHLLDGKIETSDENVLNLLGHSVAALHSVPTAIFCFLKSTNGTASHGCQIGAISIKN